MFGNRNKRYRETIAEGLSEAHLRAVTEDAALDDVKLIVFSDLHRGTGDRADDFRRCRRLYHGALGYYDSLDYRLFLLGDVEEIWERLLPSIVRKYEQTLELEQRFFERGRGVRFFGNHDEALQWQINYSQIEKYLAGEKLIESFRMRIFNEASDKDPLGEIYFAHGHQGQSYNAFHRFVVSWLWAPIQMVTGAKPQKFPFIPAKFFSIPVKGNSRKENENLNELFGIGGNCWSRAIHATATGLASVSFPSHVMYSSRTS